MQPEQIIYAKDIRLMAFNAYIQNLFCNNQNNIYDSLEIINNLANQLDIPEDQINDVIKQVIEKDYKIEDKYLQENEIQSAIDNIASRIHPADKKSRKVVNLVDKASLNKLDLIGEYELFHSYYKNGCTLQQLQQLRDQMLNKVQNYLK